MSPANRQPGLSWRKSSYSGGGNDADCVEVAAVPATVAVRDSKAPDGGLLLLPTRSWAVFSGLSGFQSRAH